MTVGNSNRERIDQTQGIVGGMSLAEYRRLQERCVAKSEQIRERFAGRYRVSLHEPFVLAGDVDREKLDALYEKVILPISQALQTCYFDRIPTEPITVMIFSGEKPFRIYASEVDGYRTTAYSGYYRRSERKIVLDDSSGEGTLAHELTHSLAHFDFPHMPIWFDEGLASLHEECEFSDDNLKLIGFSNWRVNQLKLALKQNRLPGLKAFFSEGMKRDRREAIKYAYARYFCLYLQKRGLLSHFYRKLRAANGKDETGIATLKQLLHVSDLDGFEHQLVDWMHSISSENSPVF